MVASALEMGEEDGMSSELRFSMIAHRDEMNARGLFTWQSQIKLLAERFTQDHQSLDLLTPETYDLSSIDDGRMVVSGEYGDYVDVEAFEALAERFVMALELIKLMEDNQSSDQPIQAQRDAFLAGAKWWEFHSTNGTMWQSDQKEVWAKAFERYPGEPSAPTDLVPR